MTDDLATLIAQTGGQLTGMIIKTGILSLPATTLGLVGIIANPLLALPAATLTGVVPAMAIVAAAAIAAGILK